jgi:hypothetical protein
MSIIKKSDIKRHLSTRSATSVFPFGLKSSDTAIAPGNDNAGTQADISISPSHPISPEAVPNAQVGGSVGVPNTGKSGKSSW